jgi:hypothetical protein
MIKLESDLTKLEAQVNSSIIPAVIVTDTLFMLMSVAEVNNKALSLLLKSEDPKVLDLSAYLGGNVYVVETYLDLYQVRGLKKASTETASILDGGYIFDVAERFDEYIKLILISNNGGGNTFFVPTLFIPSCMYLNMALRERKNVSNG